MDGTPKQLIAQRIKDATNILVTVNRNPSVDQLAAALALTLMINKLDKHATAVFSGEIPHAIEFLEPGKTFENTVSSLRDFIIALDKEKADRLRYKVEDGLVRIFITPYRTTITQDDLQFTQGDFNVELIIGLGVDKKEDLDAAVEAHGRILHDATVVTINDHNGKNSLGEIDWSDSSASSLSEMLMSLSESLKGGILDEQIANALLTGIVAATNRFSNDHTSPKVMTMAAQLMAAGANQQLITAQLKDLPEMVSASEQYSPNAEPAPEKPKDGFNPLKEGSSAKLSADEPQEKKADGEIQVEHAKPDALTVANELHQETPTPQTPAQPAHDDMDLPLPPAGGATPSVSDLQKDIASATNEFNAAAGPAPMPPVQQLAPQPPIDLHEPIAEPPTIGGTLNATTAEAEAAKYAEEHSRTNHTILQHGPIGQTEEDPNDPMKLDYEETPENGYLNSSKVKTVQPLSEQPRTSDLSGLTLSEIDARERGNEPMMPVAPPLPVQSPVDDARAAIDAIYGTPVPPLASPADPGYIPAAEPVSPPSVDPTQPVSTPLPPLPDFSTLPPLPPQQPAAPQFPAGLGQAPLPPQQNQPPQEQPPQNPGQFQIPGQ